MVKRYDRPTTYIIKGNDNKVRCKCGHTVEFWAKKNKLLCHGCNHWVYKNKKEEFKDKFKGASLNVNRKNVEKIK